MRTDAPPSETLLLASLERRVSKQTFDTWFRPLTVNSSPAEAVFRFSAPNPIVKDWVLTHYNDMITQSLRELSLDHYRVEWSLPGTVKKSDQPVNDDVGRQSEPSAREEADQIP